MKEKMVINLKFSPEGLVLRTLRINKGMRVKDVAMRLAISETYLYQIENGHSRPPRGEQLFSFLDLYGIKAKYYQELVRNVNENDLHRKGQCQKRKGHKGVVITPECLVLKSLREESGLSVREASVKLGYSGKAAYVSQIENGRVPFPVDQKLEKFLDLYDTKLSKYKSLVRDYKIEKNDIDKIGSMLPKLKVSDVKMVLSIIETMLSKY